MSNERATLLELLAKRQPDLFGANGHGFLLSPTLSESTVAEFENRHGITLPEDYRWFITNVGNGGAGPS